MRLLTLADLKLAISDMLTHRDALLTSCAAGQLYKPMLTKKLAEIDALPAAPQSDKSVVERLTAADLEHDGFGAALWHTTEAYLRHPTVAPAIKEAAQRLRDAFIPRLAALTESYATEASAAIERKKQLPLREADLGMFPVAGGGTLFDWALAFLDRGESLRDLLGEKADAAAAAAASSRLGSGHLKSDAIGLLQRLRSALDDEMASNEALPRDLDLKLFAMVDELTRRRDEGPSPVSIPLPSGAYSDAAYGDPPQDE